jgi:hypothetical protein
MEAAENSCQDVASKEKMKEKQPCIALNEIRLPFFLILFYPS